jgi:protein-arginine kinase activator protein McsA
MPTEDLQILLEDAVKDEDYDLAMEIQEEIKKRKKKID